MTWDPVWEEVYNSGRWGKYPNEDIVRFTASNFYQAADRSKIRFLEVGCGTGANLWFLAREGFTVYGIDGSETAVKMAMERLNEEVPGWKGEILVGDIIDLPFEASRFDAVVDNEAVYCNSFENSKTIYNEMARVTKTNGFLYARTFAKGSWGDESGELVGHNAWMVSEGPMLSKGYSRFTEKQEISSLIQGFELQSVELVTRTAGNSQHTIKEWSIVGRKTENRWSGL